MQANFWLIYENKCAVDCICIFEQETTSIYNLFLSGT